MAERKDTPVPEPPPHQQARVSTKASEHFRQVRRELSETPPMGTPPPDPALASLDRSREIRMRAWFELLEVERDATDPQLAKLAGVLRRLLGTSHGPT